METAVQTPPSYAGEGTGSRRDPHSGPSGSSSNSSSSSGLAHHRRQQALAARGPPSTAGGSGRTRGGPADGGGTGGSSRKRPAKTGVSFEPDSANTSNGNGPHEATVAHYGKSKRRKRQHPDLKFMLGGSITDPLNLRSLENEEENRRANQTPVPSPAPAGGGGSERVEVIIPRDINDPLNLNAPEPQPGVPASVPGAGAVSGETLTAQQHQQKQQPHTEHQQPKQQLQQNHQQQQQQQQHHHQQQQQQQQPQQQQGSFTDRRRDNNNTGSNDNIKPLQRTAFKRNRRRRNRYQHQARMAIAAGWRGQGGEVSFRDGWNSTTTARAGPSTDSTHCGGGATIPGSAASAGRRGTRNNPQRQQLSANEGSSSSTSNTHQSHNNSINKGNNNNNSNDKSKPDNHGSNSGIKNNRNSAGGSSGSSINNNNNNNNNKSDIRNGTDNSCNKSNSNNDNNNNNNKNRSGSANSSSNQRFRFGNYNRYYGYRNGADGDSRLPLLQREWFEGNVCLDIGCNVGHVTLSVARDFAPKEMIGIDIDPALIRIAKKNVRHYMHEGNTHGNWFPESCALTFGPISMGPASAAAAGRAASTQNNTGAGVGCGIGSAGFGGASPPDPVDDGRTSRRSTCRRTGSCNDVRDSSGAGGGPSRTLLSETAGLSRPDENAAMKRPQSLCRGAPTFPYNVFFSETNYVLENDEQLETQQEQFDTIMCLSTSKWIQLNFGDAGLKRAFRRVFRQLRPGGLFVFEPQPLSSYRKFCAPEHRENFRRMQLKPDDFPDFLIREVGFASCEILGVGSHGSKNFQRPVYLLRKGKQQNAGGEHKDSSRARSCASDDANPSKGDTASQNSNDSKGECGKNPSTSTKITAESHEQSPSASDSALRPSPAHECDTTTASI